MAQLGRKPNLERRRHAAELRKQGLTLEEIGRRLGGISRQAVHQLLRHSAANGRKKRS